MTEPIAIPDIPHSLVVAAERATLAFYEETGHPAVLRAILPPHVLPFGLGEVLITTAHGECALIDGACFEELRAETEARLREVPP